MNKPASRVMRASLVLLPVFGCANFAMAADECRHVLDQGAFKMVKDHHQSAYQEYFYTQLVNKSSQQAKKDAAAGLFAGLDSFIMKAANNESDWSDVQHSIENTLIRQIGSVDYDDILLYEGDPAILAAWTDCLRSHGGGLAAHFEKGADPTGHVVDFELEYIKPAQGHFPDYVKLDQPIRHPGVVVLDGEQCLSNSQPIYSGNPCRATLRLHSARATVDWAVNASPYSTRASLPARLHHVVTRSWSYEVDLANSAVTLRHSVPQKMQTVVGGHIALTREQVEQGWSFVPDSGGVPVVIINNGTKGEPMEYCRNGTFTSISPTLAAYQYEYSNGSSYDLTCEVHPYIRVQRDYWAADDEDLPPQQIAQRN